MLNTTDQQGQGKHGFSSDFKQYYFRDLVFNVDFNKRRKRISVVFNRESCTFSLKIGRYPQWWTQPAMLKSIDVVLSSNYSQFQVLLHENVCLSDISAPKQENQYATGDIVYLYGLPYRLEVEYEMKPNYILNGKRTQDSVMITSQPQQLLLMMVPEGTSRYAGKFDRLCAEGYYKKELLNKLPVLVTQAAADYHNKWRLERLQEIKRAENDLNTMLQEKTGMVFSHSAEESASDNLNDGSYFGDDSGFDDYYEDDWTNDSSIVSSGHDLEAFAEFADCDNSADSDDSDNYERCGDSDDTTDSDDYGNNNQSQAKYEPVVLASLSESCYLPLNSRSQSPQSFKELSYKDKEQTVKDTCLEGISNAVAVSSQAKASDLGIHAIKTLSSASLNPQAVKALSGDNSQAKHSNLGLVGNFERTSTSTVEASLSDISRKVVSSDNCLGNSSDSGLSSEACASGANESGAGALLGEINKKSKSGLISEKDKLTLNLPLQAGLVLPPRHMEFIKSVYLKRALLDYAWLFTLDQGSFEFDSLVRHYGSVIQFLSAKLYGDLWQSLVDGNLCNNRYLLDADGAFIELFAGVETQDFEFDCWFTKQWSRLCSYGLNSKQNRFYSSNGSWLISYRHMVESSSVGYFKRNNCNFKYRQELSSELLCAKTNLEHKQICDKKLNLGWQSIDIAQANDEHGAIQDEHGTSQAEGAGAIKSADSPDSITNSNHSTTNIIHASVTPQATVDKIHLSSGATLSKEESTSSCGDSMVSHGTNKAYAKGETEDNKRPVLGMAGLKIGHVGREQGNNDLELDEAELADLDQDLGSEYERDFLIKEMMFDWYEGRQNNIELTKENLELNFALCPLLKREKEEELLQAMVTGDNIQSQDIHLTSDIIGSQHWELTGPLRDRLIFKKLQGISYEYPSDSDMHNILTSKEYENVGVPFIGTSKVYWDYIHPKWDQGRLNELYIERKFNVQDSKPSRLLGDLSKVKECLEIVKKSNSNKAISWWPNNPTQTVSCSPLELRQRFDLISILQREGIYVANQPLSRSLDTNFREHILYLLMNELTAEQNAAKKVNQLKRRNLDKAQGMHGQPSSDGIPLGNSAQSTVSSQDLKSSQTEQFNQKGKQQALFGLDWWSTGKSSMNFVSSLGHQEMDGREVEDEHSIEHDKAQGLFKTQFKRNDGINEDCPVLSFTGYAPKREQRSDSTKDNSSVQHFNNLLESRVLAKGGTQYALCVDLDSDLLDCYPELLKKQLGCKDEQASYEQSLSAQNLSEQSPREQSAKELGVKAQSASERTYSIRKQVRGDLLLPNMCWTLGAKGEEIDPAEALPAHQDIFFPPEQKIDMDLYEQVVGLPRLAMYQTFSAKKLGRNLAIVLRENDKFPHSEWALRYWDKTLVRPGVIKIKVAYRNFKEFDSVKECQYRFDLVMRLFRKELTRQVLAAVRLFCNVKEEGEIAYHIDGTPDFVSFTELKRGEGVEGGHPLHNAFSALLNDEVFERCVIAGGVSVQGRCTRGNLNKGYDSPHFSQVLTISQTLAAVPFSYTLSVIAHECCHLAVFDHSTAFKKLLRTICPYDNFLDSKWLEIKHLVNVSPMRQRLGKVDVVRVGKE